jgi:hypothetical protein
VCEKSVSERGSVCERERERECLQMLLSFVSPKERLGNVEWGTWLFVGFWGLG